MKLAPTKISLSIATLGVALLAGTPAMAADTQPARSDTTPNATTLRNGMDYSDRARMKTWSDEKDQLERQLTYFPQVAERICAQFPDDREAQRGCGV